MFIKFHRLPCKTNVLRRFTGGQNHIIRCYLRVAYKLRLETSSSFCRFYFFRRRMRERRFPRPPVSETGTRRIPAQYRRIPPLRVSRKRSVDSAGAKYPETTDTWKRFAIRRHAPRSVDARYGYGAHSER